MPVHFCHLIFQLQVVWIGLTNLPKNDGDQAPCLHTFRRLLDKHRKPSQSSSFELSQGRCQSAQRLCERKVKEFAPLSNVSILIKMHQKASKHIKTYQNVSNRIKITDQNVSKRMKTHHKVSKHNMGSSPPNILSFRHPCFRCLSTTSVPYMKMMTPAHY